MKTIGAAASDYEYKYRGKIIKGVHKGDVDRSKDIRAALREYFGLDKSDG